MIDDVFEDPLTEEELDRLIEADLVALGLLSEGESLSLSEETSEENQELEN